MSWICEPNYTGYLSIICAVYLTTRIITKEQITEGARIFFRNKNLYSLDALFSCFFCMSCWIGILFGLIFELNIFILIVGANIILRVVP